MCKKKFFLIGLQVAVLAGFVMMALGSGSNAAVVKGSQPKRMDRGACGHADYVLMGQHPSKDACSQACRNAGFADFCMTGDNCFCK